LQVFNLAVLPGTAFREEATKLGLVYQPRPPYYVLKTPDLSRTDLFGLMQEAQDLFEIEFDAQPRPVLDFRVNDSSQVWWVDLDGESQPGLPSAGCRGQAFTLWLRSASFGHRRHEAVGHIQRLLAENPFTTLQVVLEPIGSITPEAVRREVEPGLLGELMAACQANPTYLDKFYALQPGRQNGAKRLIVVLPLSLRTRLPLRWIEDVGESSTLVWQTGPEERDTEGAMEPHENVWPVLVKRKSGMKGVETVTGKGQKAGTE
jgi:hypothetical protein